MTSFSDWTAAADDLREWAYSDDPEPQQDFDLLITGVGHEDLFLEFVEDESCAKRTYFLGCLYLFVGDAVRTGFESSSKSDVEALLGRVASAESQATRKWRERSLELIRRPEMFNYDQWCAGGFSDEAR